jgi:hypothetical protein
MVHTQEERDLRTQPEEEEGWDVDFNEVNEAPARRRLSDHERWVLERLIHEAPSR